MRYRAFISYSQQDQAWGKRLHTWLERYKIPLGALVGISNDRRLGRFFRDEEEMPAAADIAGHVRDAIDHAESLIVICSPRSARSEWVNAEIHHFRRTGRADKVFAVIIDGAPNSGDPETECFPPALRASGDPNDPDALPIEPLGLDIRKDGRDRACARLAAGLLDIDFDDLWQRDRRRAEQRQRATIATLAGVALVFAALAGFAFHQTMEARNTLNRFFAERAWQKLDEGDALAAARYALAGMQIAPVNARHYRAALAAVLYASGEAVAVYPFSAPARCVAVSPDGARILVSGFDVSTELRTTADGARVATLIGDCAVFSPDGARIATTSPEGLRIWDARTAQLVGRFTTDLTVSPTFSPDGAYVAAGSENTARLWRVADGRMVLTLRAHTDVCSSVAFSPDGRRLVTAGEESVAKVWDARSGRLVATLRHDAAVVSAVFSPNGERILTASADGVAYEWNARTFRRERALTGHAQGLTGAAYAPDGARIVTTGYDSTARVWETRAGRLIDTLHGHERGVYAAAFLPNGEVLTAGANYAFARWRVRETRTVGSGPRSTPDSFFVRYAPDGAALFVASSTAPATMFEARSGRTLATFAIAEHDITGAVFAPDGAQIVVAASDGDASVWRVADGARTLTLPGASSAAAYARDGGRIATAGEDGVARVWDAREGRLLQELSGHEAPLTGIAFAPNGQSLATASEDMTARLWSGGRQRAVLTHEDMVFSAAFSPDGARVLTASADMSAKVWEARSGRLRFSLEHLGDVYTAEFSRDGARIVTASQDNTAKVWDARTGRLIVTLAGHERPLVSATFSADGARVLTAGSEGRVMIWDVADGRRLAVLAEDLGDLYGAAFSPDDADVAVSRGDGPALVLEAGALTQTWPALATRACTRLLAPDSRRFWQDAIDEDQLLMAEWRNANRDVCAGAPSIPPLPPPPRDP